MADSGETGGGTSLGLLKAGGWAVGIAMAVNGALYLVGESMGAFPPDAVVSNRNTPVTLGPVLALSAAGSAVGVTVYAVLRQFTDKAWMVFIGMAVAVVLVMAVPPFQIQEVPTAQIVLLEIMHLVAAGATIGAVARYR